MELSHIEMLKRRWHFFKVLIFRSFYPLISSVLFYYCFTTWLKWNSTMEQWNKCQSSDVLSMKGTVAWQQTLIGLMLPSDLCLIAVMEAVTFDPACVIFSPQSSVMMNCQAPRRPYRVSQMTTIFITLLCFPSFLGASVCVTYTMWRYAHKNTNFPTEVWQTNYLNFKPVCIYTV